MTQQQQQTNRPLAKLASGSGQQTKRYLSVKVRVQSEEAIQWALFALTDSLGHLTTSEEIFFRVPQGQLKLRLAHPGKDIGELISFRTCPPSTADIPTAKAKMAATPNFFECRISKVPEAAQLRHTLNLCMEELAVIRKKRRTFNLGPVNFHLDSVEGLDSFLDIEIHPGGDSDDKLVAKAEELLKQLGISSRAQIAHSYLELFLKSQEKREESDESAFSDESVP